MAETLENEKSRLKLGKWAWFIRRTGLPMHRNIDVDRPYVPFRLERRFMTFPNLFFDTLVPPEEVIKKTRFDEPTTGFISFKRYSKELPELKKKNQERKEKEDKEKEEKEKKEEEEREEKEKKKEEARLKELEAIRIEEAKLEEKLKRETEIMEEAWKQTLLRREEREKARIEEELRIAAEIDIEEIRREDAWLKEQEAKVKKDFRSKCDEESEKKKEEVKKKIDFEALKEKLLKIAPREKAMVKKVKECDDREAIKQVIEPWLENIRQTRIERQKLEEPTDKYLKDESETDGLKAENGKFESRQAEESMKSTLPENEAQEAKIEQSPTGQAPPGVNAQEVKVNMVENEKVLGPVQRRQWLDLDVIDTTFMEGNVHGLRHGFFNINKWILMDYHDVLTLKREIHG
eukprot:GHVP01004716.1.p3 GENE.GHVP01004716.1~~GHVP01004716.1.p3  ORF type:complete len:405 (+),score=113.82 GHVP01004716.1:3511-4725(+)